MSYNDYILNLLNIKDKNIFINKNFNEERNIKGKNTKIIYGVLTYNPEYCPICGVINESTNDIIKWGFKNNCKIKIPKASNINTLLILNKQRFYCKHCNNTFIAETSLVNKFKNISNNTELKIRLDLMDKISEKDVAKNNNVSVSKVDEILDDISSKKVMLHETLPTEMNWDEFKATKDTKGKMAFLITNNENSQVFDILDSRKSIDLYKYFRRYSWTERDKVKLISTDFYVGYIELAKKLFKNADIVIDRFHIVIQAYNALNYTRVKLCYKTNPNYNKLKDYWKLIVKNENDLSEKKEYAKHFKKEMSQKDIVNFIINTDKTLKVTYETYQGLINSIKNKDFNKFKSIIHHPNSNISDKMKQALKLYRNNEKYIENSFKYDINNGRIEGTNNYIKCIKRIAFGYRKFSHFKARILLNKGIIKG